MGDIVVTVTIDGRVASVVGGGQTVPAGTAPDHAAVLFALAQALAQLTALPPPRTPLVEAVEFLEFVEPAVADPELTAAVENMRRSTVEARARVEREIRANAVAIQAAAAEAAGAPKH